jgi:hypothetical protein
MVKECFQETFKKESQLAIEHLLQMKLHQHLRQGILWTHHQNITTTDTYTMKIRSYWQEEINRKIALCLKKELKIYHSDKSTWDILKR